MATGSDTVLCVNSLTVPVTVTASVVGTTKTALDSHAMDSGIVSGVGRNLHMRAWGLLTTSVTPVTYNVTVEYGTTVLCQTGAFTPTALLTNMAWELWCEITTITSGAPGTVEAQGIFDYYSAATTLNPQTMSNTATVSVTNTGVVTPRIAITFGGSTAGNSITIRTDLWEAGGLT